MPHAQGAGPGPAVVLIEDSPLLRRALRAMLEAIGCTVVAELATEVQALRWIDQHAGAWDLAIVDLVLEQGTGMAVIAACRAQRDAGAVAVFSEYATAEVRAHCEHLGADAVFGKGRDLPALRAYCEQFAARRRPAREA